MEVDNSSLFFLNQLFQKNKELCVQCGLIFHDISIFFKEMMKNISKLTLVASLMMSYATNFSLIMCVNKFQRGDPLSLGNWVNYVALPFSQPPLQKKKATRAKFKVPLTFFHVYGIPHGYLLLFECYFH